MGKLISVVGNTGVGKTTLVNQICEISPLTRCLEQLSKRPFQELFMLNHQRYALANQIDFLLFRSEQELEIRRGDRNGIQDGGLDEDFNVFTRLFWQHGYLNKDEFDLCERAYLHLREIHPAPDLIVWLKAPRKVIAERFRDRDRRLGIASLEDLEAIEVLLKKWLGAYKLSPVIDIDTTVEDINYSISVEKILDYLQINL